MNRLAAGATLMACTLLSGCSEKQVADTFRGKFEKYAECLRKGRELNLSETAIKPYCAGQYESVASADALTSTSSGSAKYCSTQCSSFSGYLSNTSKKTMITHVKVSVHSASNPQVVDLSEYDGLELMPASSKDFYVQLKNVQVAPDSSGAVHGYTWQIEDVKGIQFDF